MFAIGLASSDDRIQFSLFSYIYRATAAMQSITVRGG